MRFSVFAASAAFVAVAVATEHAKPEEPKHDEHYANDYDKHYKNDYDYDCKKDECHPPPHPVNTTMTYSTTYHPTPEHPTTTEHYTSYTTEVVTKYTTYCPEPTVITHGTVTYTVTEPTTLTITDCPCTVTKPVFTVSTITECHDCYTPTETHTPETHLPPVTHIETTVYPVYPNETHTTPAYTPPVGTGSATPVTPFEGAGSKVFASGAALAAVFAVAAYLM